jgi:hypothetical protein
VSLGSQHSSHDKQESNCECVGINDVTLLSGEFCRHQNSSNSVVLQLYWWVSISALNVKMLLIVQDNIIYRCAIFIEWDK